MKYFLSASYTINIEERRNLVDPEENVRIHSEINFLDGRTGLEGLIHVAEEEKILMLRVQYSTNKKLQRGTIDERELWTKLAIFIQLNKNHYTHQKRDINFSNALMQTSVKKTRSLCTGNSKRLYAEERNDSQQKSENLNKACFSMDLIWSDCTSLLDSRVLLYLFKVQPPGNICIKRNVWCLKFTSHTMQGFLLLNKLLRNKWHINEYQSYQCKILQISRHHVIKTNIHSGIPLPNTF